VDSATPAEPFCSSEFPAGNVQAVVGGCSYAVGMHASDTTAEARAVQLAAYRSMGPDRRCALAFEMSEELRLITLEGLRERSPDATESELVLSLIGLWHGDELAEQVRRSPEDV